MKNFFRPCDVTCVSMSSSLTSTSVLTSISSSVTPVTSVLTPGHFQLNSLASPYVPHLNLHFPHPGPDNLPGTVLLTPSSLVQLPSNPGSSSVDTPPSPITSATASSLSIDTATTVAPPPMVIGKAKAPVQKKTKTKSPALSPDDFERESLKVERDACRMKMTELATDKKDLAETVEVLTTRCRLLEQERNRKALEKAAPEALEKAPPYATSVSTPAPLPLSSTPLETLIHLEVLKAIKSLSPKRTDRASSGNQSQTML